MWSWFLTLLSWAHLQLIEPTVRWWEEVVLGSWEEWLLALVRQGFEEATRFLNAVGTWFLSLFSKRRYREQLRRAWQENSWQQWWGEVATRPSTLNALVANLVAQQQQQQHIPREKAPDTGSAALQRDSDAVSCPNPGSSPTGEVPAAADASLLEGSRLHNDGCSSIGREQVAARAGRPTGSGSVWWPRPTNPSNGSAGGTKAAGRASLTARLERPVVFVQQSGMGILDELAKRRHGLIEDAKMAAQLAVSRAFDLARSSVRAVLFLPSRESLASQYGFARRGAAQPDGGAGVSDSVDNDSSGGSRWRYTEGPAAARATESATVRGPPPKVHLQRSKSAHVNIAEMAYKPGAGAGAATASMSRRGLRRSRSYGRLHSGAGVFGQHTTEAPSDALSVIRAAGYPHELHTVTTDDGYVLRLERIPRPGARDVVFFMHGVLDTSMAWVSGGVTGSQAFAAWEAGMDVWLGNSRGNSPRQHQDPSRRGWRYWQYNINHMGMYDIAAQLDHMHNIKCAELGAGTVTLDLDHLGPLAGSFLGGGGGGGSKRSPVGASVVGLLPGRTASTSASRGGPEAPGGPARGVRSSVRMRQSNSDGNLYRWGSCASAASSSGSGGGGCGSVLPAGTPGRAAAADVVGSPGCGATAGVGTVPEHLPAPSAPSSRISAAGLGRAVSSHGLLSPMPSCDGSEDGHSGSGVEGRAGAAAGPDQGQEADQEPDTGGASWDVGRAEGAVMRGLGQVPPASLPRDAGAPASHRTSAARPSSSLAPAPAHAAAGKPVCRNAVTLTFISQPSDGLSGAPAAASAPRPATTTFTLEAKTRRDFGSGAVSTPKAPGVGGSKHFPEMGLASGCAPAASGSTRRLSHAVGGADGGAHAAGGGAGAGGSSTAASMLDAVGSVLGPAADAVTQAMASAAATAGAALATAAVSATSLLQPSLQRGPGTAAAGPAPAAAAPALTAASPFAVAAVQTASGVVDDVEERGAGAAQESSQAAWLDSGWAAQQRKCPAGPAADFKGQQPLPQRQPQEVRVLTGAAGSREPAAVPEAATPRSARGGGPQRNPLFNGFSFRRVCSTDQLDGSGGSGGLGRAGGFTPSLLTAPERAGSGQSAGSGSSGGDGGAAASEGWAEGVTTLLSPPGGPVGTAGSNGGGGMGRSLGGSRHQSCPYKLRCVAHSLGGMSMLIHLVNRLREGRPHNISRLLLLTPAGFHKHCPRASRPIMFVLPLVTHAFRAVFGRTFCFPLYIPTFLGRALTFKLLLSASRIPGLGELLRLGFKALLDGDISQWDRALQMPHYSAEDMPAISVDQVLHLVQLVKSNSFQLYDYGSPAANVAHYGSVRPPDVSSEYWRLDLPVHLVAGRRDGVIPPPNICRHFDAMRTQGVAVSYREYDFGHLDFTFGVKEELRMYLMKVLRL